MTNNLVQIETENTYKEVIDFIQLHFIKEITRLQDNNFHHISFFVISNAIEMLGALLDTKPFRAKSQSAERFGNAIFKLFPKEYRTVNQNNRLYTDYRCNMAHLFIPSSKILFLTKADSIILNKSHLQETQGQLVLIAEDLANDLKYASEKLIDKINRGEVKYKKGFNLI